MIYPQTVTIQVPTQQCMAGSWTCNLLITSLTPYPLHHQATLFCYFWPICFAIVKVTFGHQETEWRLCCLSYYITMANKGLWTDSQIETVAYNRWQQTAAHFRQRRCLLIILILPLIPQNIQFLPKVLYFWKKNFGQSPLASWPGALLLELDPAAGTAPRYPAYSPILAIFRFTYGVWINTLPVC